MNNGMGLYEGGDSQRMNECKVQPAPNALSDASVERTEGT